MDTSERIQIASDFLLQAPPGEINDVLNDVRNIISDDDALQAGVRPALREYNLQQFITVEVPGVDHQCIISEAARLHSGRDEERFMDPRSKISFIFDHLSLEASDPEPYEYDPQTESLRLALESSTQTYLAAHYHDGVASVFARSNEVKEYIIQIVANKYNPSNYWWAHFHKLPAFDLRFKRAGRWRSEYTIDLENNRVTGRILVHVHYYEQGNVQLATKHDISLTLPSGIYSMSEISAAPKILAVIGDEETKYQVSLSETYQEMSEKTFKSLRRTLPMTRSKLDWDKILGYKLGAELSGSKEGHGSS